MRNMLLTEIESFMAETGLSAHRVGIILANNGRLVDRLRDGRRIWPDTEAAIWAAMSDERTKRAASDTRGAA